MCGDAFGTAAHFVMGDVYPGQTATTAARTNPEEEERLATPVLDDRQARTIEAKHADKTGKPVTSEQEKTVSGITIGMWLLALVVIMIFFGA